jgi:hypothetical protein
LTEDVLQEISGSQTIPVTVITRLAMLGAVIGICAGLHKISAYSKPSYKTSAILGGGLSGMKDQSLRRFAIAVIRFDENRRRSQPPSPNIR